MPYCKAVTCIKDLVEKKKYIQLVFDSLQFTYFSTRSSALIKCDIRIDKSVSRVTVWHHKALPVMQNSDPRDRLVYLNLILIIHSFSCISLR